MLDRFIISFIAAILWMGPAYAHHNAAARYLPDELVTVEGVVSEFRLISPHARIYIDVTTSTGNVEPWLAEGRAAGILKRVGWTKSTLKKGDFITITGHPARDGANAMDWTLIILPDGTVLRGGNPDAEERERRLRELDNRRRQ
jgi:hypothetical protein